MKDIEIEFHNIQSHEHTKFSLHPGLNFILAEDNNVGKSTIFKVLLCAMQLPNVNQLDLLELLRGGCSQGYAAFKFDEVLSTMWLFRESGKAPRAFFETTRGSESAVRTLGAPQELRDAFDIVSSSDGKVINFNDADSVQLIVQDTPKNDEVLAKVLVDVKVDDIKENMVRLGQMIQQDYRMVQSKLDDDMHILSSMHYVDAVDDFKSERARLSEACYLADTVLDVWKSIVPLKSTVDMSEFVRFDAALEIYGALCGLELQESPIVQAVTPDVFDHFTACLDALQLLEISCGLNTKDKPRVTEVQLDNAKIAIEVYQQLMVADTAMYYAEKEKQAMREMKTEESQLVKKLNEISRRVICPVKGEVFYTDEECVPVSDGFALRHGEDEQN